MTLVRFCDEIEPMKPTKPSKCPSHFMWFVNVIAVLGPQFHSHLFDGHFFLVSKRKGGKPRENPGFCALNLKGSKNDWSSPSSSVSHIPQQLGTFVDAIFFKKNTGKNWRQIFSSDFFWCANFAKKLWRNLTVRVFSHICSWIFSWKLKMVS